MKPKQWIVYLTPDDEVKAVADNHTGQQQAELTGELNVILGTPCMETANDAITYIKQVAM